MRELADEVRDFLIEKNIWYDSDTRIYFDNMCYCSKQGELHDIDPRRYFEYANPHTLSMSFEGYLYEVFNYGASREILNELDRIFTKYGYYWELGNSWNLSLFNN